MTNLYVVLTSVEITEPSENDLFIQFSGKATISDGQYLALGDSIDITGNETPAQLNAMLVNYAELAVESAFSVNVGLLDKRYISGAFNSIL